ncbi:hypothetical protein [Bosea sp. NBC_00550]|uniref:hypothetical protein n=1 Tax=Bosea sp. NBC_00550 TaxID=2969621 RepID=UPI002230AB90|nr:hypothetical protein [Bosea sp. NBC_00550]UZF93450.1 hypothetical protein NWE53_04375 [Bosea sp. NBC_00550]
MARRYRLTAYDIGAPATCRLERGNIAFAFAQAGEVAIGDRRFAEGDGGFARPGDLVASSGCAWLFELAPEGSVIRQGDGLSPVLSRIVTLPEGDFMLRADRVGSGAGVRTPAHRHRGPGIRRLLTGLLLADVGDQLDRVGPGQAWFESGHETVIGTNISGAENVFVRLMLLPTTLTGGESSFIPANPEEAAKPRAVRLHLFGECLLAPTV